MTPIHLAPIAATISGLGATASLIYVGVQTRVSVRHAGAIIHQGAAARTTTILLRMMEPENVAAWIEGNSETPTPELIRQRQFHYQCGVTMVAMEDYVSQHEAGLLSEEQFARGSATFARRSPNRGSGTIRSSIERPWSRRRRATARLSTACAPAELHPSIEAGRSAK